MNAHDDAAPRVARRRLAPNVLCMFDQDRATVRQQPRPGRNPKKVVSMWSFRFNQAWRLQQQSRVLELSTRLAELEKAIAHNGDRVNEYNSQAGLSVFLRAEIARATALEHARIHASFVEEFQLQRQVLLSDLARLGRGGGSTAAEIQKRSRST